jgi:hypothetical protein
MRLMPSLIRATFWLTRKPTRCHQSLILFLNHILAFLPLALFASFAVSSRFIQGSVRFVVLPRVRHKLRESERRFTAKDAKNAKKMRERFEPVDHALDAVLDQGDVLAHEKAQSMPPELEPLP